jgi:hypothetical protein
MRNLLIVVLIVNATTASAAEKKANESTKAPTHSLRNAQQIVLDYQAAIGSESAWSQHQSIHIKREISMKAMHFSGTEEMVIAQGGKFYDTSVMPGIGTLQIGTNGKVAWSEDPINGLRILKGAEAEEIRLAAIWNAEWRLQQTYKTIRSAPLPAEAPAAAEWECIELQKSVGKPTILCFDSVTHLRVLEKGTKASLGGDMPYVSRFSDWRKLKGVLVWHQEVLTVGPMVLEAKVTRITFDKPIPPKRFELPVKAASPTKKPATPPSTPTSSP